MHLEIPPFTAYRLDFSASLECRLQLFWLEQRPKGLKQIAQSFAVLTKRMQKFGLCKLPATKTQDRASSARQRAMHVGADCRHLVRSRAQRGQGGLPIFDQAPITCTVQGRPQIGVIARPCGSEYRNETALESLG